MTDMAARRSPGGAPRTAASETAAPGAVASGAAAPGAVAPGAAVLGAAPLGTGGVVLPRRAALALGAAAAAALPRLAIAQADQRPAITVAVQKIANSNTLDPLREQSNVGTRLAITILENLIGMNGFVSARARGTQVACHGGRG